MFRHKVWPSSGCIKENLSISYTYIFVCRGGCIWCRVGGVGARSRKRVGLGYRLVGKHAWTEMLGLLMSMFLGLGYMSMCPNGKCSICIQNLLA